MDACQQQDSFTVNQAIEKWRRLTANDCSLLKEEFASLRQFDQNRVTIATNPINKSKNRYGLVFPYDEDFCRVSLQKLTKTSSDYINASIIRSIPPDQISTSPPSRIFYAAQGPLDQTLDDFLRMIIEQQITLIVMLSFSYDPITRTYAPEHATYFSEKPNKFIDTESYRIRTTHVIPSYRYIIRRLRIESKSTNHVHFCEQYHYPHFVDKGTPTDYHSIIGLAMKLRENQNQNHRILVHCSAGVGRTGVFLALYYLFEAFERHQKLNVRQLVDTIRLYRPHLVQTLEQYEYIYRCLAEISIHPCDGQILEKFLEYWKIVQRTIHENNNSIAYEFQNRNKRVELDSSFTMNMAEQHQKANRNPLFLPYDRNRIILHSPSESMYINASKIPNIVGSRAIILTQEPMKTTLQPYFSMLLQEHKNFIVAVEQMENLNYTESPFVHRSEIRVEILPVEYTRKKFNNYHRSHKIKIRYSDLRELDVFVFEYTGEWLDDGSYLPKDLEQFIRFVDRSIYHQRKLDPTRLGLVVHDRDGGTKAAFYCIVQNLFDRLLIDGQISIENFVADICQQRNNALMSLKQYNALYEIVFRWNELRRRGALECTMNNELI